MVQGERDLHATHGQKRYQGDLVPPLQLEVPDKESGDDGEGEIRDDTEDTVQVGESDDDFDVDARTGSAVVLGPEVLDGVALEESDEEKGKSGEEGDEHGSVDDPGMHLSHGDAQEETPDGDLGSNHGRAVEQVTEPPAIHGLLNVFRWEVVVVTTCSIMHADYG